MKINWGVKLTIAMVLFMAFIVTLVVRVSMAKPDLVAENYYEQEYEVQNKINARENVARLKNAPEIYASTGNIFVDLTESITGQDINGELYIYRPNNADMDIKMTLNSDTKFPIIIPDSDLKKGVYKVQLSWTMNENQYYQEKRIYLN